MGACRDASKLYEFSGGRQFVLPMIRHGVMPTFFSRQCSMPPAWGIGGLVGRHSISSEEVSTIMAHLASEPVLSSSIRPNPLFGSTWSAAAMKVGFAEPRLAHVLDLDGCIDNVWSKKFSHQARGSVRKAERSGLRVECDKTGKFIPIYYKLMKCSLDRWAEQQHEPRLLSYLRAQFRDPIRKFETIAQTLGETMRTWVAWLDEEPVAALIVLQGKNVYAFKSVMNKELAGPTHANELLHFHAISEGCKAGCARYHLGESGRSTSLAQFKQRFGAEPYPYSEYYIERLPVTNLDRKIRKIVKWSIGFQDAQ
jgi:hypothetical protein